MIYFWSYLFIINAAGFTLMHIDKKKAQAHRWRISEAALIGTALLGGSIGTFLGMRLFRHKTRHPKFYIGLPVIIIVQLLLIVLLALWKFRCATSCS